MIVTTREERLAFLEERVRVTRDEIAAMERQDKARPPENAIQAQLRTAAHSRLIAQLVREERELALARDLFADGEWAIPTAIKEAATAIPEISGVEARRVLERRFVTP